MKPVLAMLVAQGFSTEKGDLPATAASNVTGPAPQAAGLPKWRKKMLITELLAGLTTKLAGLGLAAKAGMGVTLAATSTTVAGAAGVLPAPAQHVVATVVATATPFTFPDEADTRAEVGATVVGADATEAGVDGKAVSDAAKTEAGTAGSGVSVGPNTGATGLDRANQTPAAGRVPTSLPAGAADAGAKASTGLGTAGSTPAAGKVPTSVPVASGAGSQGSAGVTTAEDTPAAGRIPANAPRR